MTINYGNSSETEQVRARKGRELSPHRSSARRRSPPLPWNYWHDLPMVFASVEQLTKTGIYQSGRCRVGIIS
ncbi:hypothetical protein PAXINDRAFT_171394 [Paxillus involutus ATCC 200175]|uniref:Uncharacterized protein n=1 Tax=Paxillus involutus ATCC 200175 TaxID=664439 RepID=A0A0C9TWR5_PAXIN|nr:hypothetical protein PAXINDRAFT_171394 [Paxillus involutus ATCC 200175]